MLACFPVVFVGVQWLGRCQKTDEKTSRLKEKNEAMLSRGRWDYLITFPETNVAPENRPSQNETSIPTIHFQGLC